VFLKAVQQTGDFTVLARPSIFTANSQKGIISSGERIAIPTNSNSFNNGGASTNIEYQDVVLKLEVIPLINDEETITLEIALLSDEVNGEQRIAGGGANGGDLVVPKITTREILTTVTIPNNNTIVLGGLITTRKGDDVTGIPILSSIPVLGKLFATTSKQDERAELLVFIQPSIVNNRSSLDNVQSDTDSRYRMTPDIRRFADGPGVLPPLEPVAPVSDKSGSSTPSARVSQPAATPAPASSSKMKKSIRPSHKM
jgi:type II secretory pathway component GspD/PulD (secretin)